MTSTAAKALLNGWAEASPELKLPGKRLKLHEFLAQPINGSRKDAINQYWVTFTDMANHKLAVEQSQWLSSLSNPRQPSDQSVLKAAQQSAQNRVLHTEIQLAKSQSILSDYLPNLVNSVAARNVLWGQSKFDATLGWTLSLIHI